MKNTIITFLVATIFLLLLSACIQAQQPTNTTLSTQEKQDIQQVTSIIDSLDEDLNDLNDLVDSSTMEDIDSGITDDFFQ